MARVRGPLMSLHAAGTIADALTFRTLNGRAVAQFKPTPTGERTTAQRDARGTFWLAKITWYELDEKTREQWLPYAARIRLPVFAAFVREYIRQDIAYPDWPLVPV